jgi:hypothetical protein
VPSLKFIDHKFSTMPHARFASLWVGFQLAFLVDADRSICHLNVRSTTPAGAPGGQFISGRLGVCSVFELAQRFAVNNHLKLLWADCMLGFMQQPAESLRSSTSPSFASLLAGLTTPAPGSTERRSIWDEIDHKDNFGDNLEDDVATLSYESALKANARYRPTNPDEWNLPQRIESTATLVAEEIAWRTRVAEAETARAPTGKIVPAMNVAAALDEKRRRASVTVRLSEVESAQLQQRAAEAGLTVSAYLRSCTFEAEALRAEVKEALAELRAARLALKNEKVNRVSWRVWLAKLLPQRHFGRRPARA